MRLARRGLAVLPVVLALAAAGCGGGSTGSETSSPTASAPEATAPPTDATQPGTEATPPPATTTQPAQTQTTPSARRGRGRRGGGREQSVRVPVSFTIVGAGRLRPRTITVPPFLAIELSLHARDGFKHSVVINTPEKRQVDVQPTEPSGSTRIAGLPAGRYQVRLDGVAAGALIVGGEVGP
jgi:hypothetical protein